MGLAPEQSTYGHAATCLTKKSAERRSRSSKAQVRCVERGAADICGRGWRNENDGRRRSAELGI